MSDCAYCTEISTKQALFGLIGSLLKARVRGAIELSGYFKYRTHFRLRCVCACSPQSLRFTSIIGLFLLFPLHLPLFPHTTCPPNPRYVRFFQGRRCPDDARQIGRWLKCCGPTGRWKGNLCAKVAVAGASYDDPAVSPVVRQTLLHWGYELTPEDFAASLKKLKNKGAYLVNKADLNAALSKGGKKQAKK